MFLAQTQTALILSVVIWFGAFGKYLAIPFYGGCNAISDNCRIQKVSEDKA